jgi:uncharacterized protein (TIGR03067 family)
LLVLDAGEAVMAADSSAKLNLIAAAVGAVGAVGAAILPFYLNRPAAEPAPATAKADPAPATVKGAPAPDAAKPTRDSDAKARARDSGPSKGSTARTPKTEHKALSGDLAHLQGEWAIVAQTRAKTVMTKEDLARTKTVWEFDGDKMTIRNTGDTPGLIYYRGSIKLHSGLSPKTFDFNGKNRLNQGAEMLGIYAFEGPVVVFRFQVHNIGDANKPSRPDSFKIEPGPTAGHLVRLRRVKE